MRLLCRIQSNGLHAAELAVGNTVRRVMHLIREESQVEDEEDMASARSGTGSERSQHDREGAMLCDVLHISQMLVTHATASCFA